MISIHQATDIIANTTFAKQEKLIPVKESLGYFLASDLKAPFDLPTFDNSAMDGYAVCGNGPEYEIIGEIQAGNIQKQSLREGQAFRIFTGAKIPAHSTAVIMQEKAIVTDTHLTIQDTPNPGKNIRRKGEQIKASQVVFETGQKINPSVIGLLSSFGLQEVKVYSKPGITLLTTGNELIEPGKHLKEGQLYESNGATLSAALEQKGYTIQHHEHIKDDYESTKKRIGIHLNKSNVLLISGGISVGDYDFVKKALEENGVEEIFYKVMQKPGKPLFFGRKGDTFVFGLPGNPASSLVCLHIYVVALLSRLSGSTEAQQTVLHLPLEDDYHMKFKRPSFLKSRISADGVKILEGQSSSMLLSMASGNALVLLEKEGMYQKGDWVKCYDLG